MIYSMYVVTRQVLIFLHCVDCCNQCSPSTGGIVITAIRSAICALIDYIKSALRPKMPHKSDGPNPTGARDSVVMEPGLPVLICLQKNAKPSHDIVQYLPRFHRRYSHV